FAGADFDVSIAAWLLGETSSNLNNLVNERLGIELVSLQSLTGTGRNAKALSQCSVAEVAEYACQQAEMLLRIRPQLEDQIKERGQSELFADMEMALVPVLF